MKNRSSIFILGCILVCQTLILFPYIFVEVFNIDETIFAVAAQEILHGNLLYTDIWDIKPPYIFFIYAFIFKFFKPDIVSVHWLTLAVKCLTTVGIFLTGRSLFTRELGLISAFLFTVFSTTYLPTDFLASNTETFMLLPVVFGMYAFLCAESSSESSRYMLYGVSGLLFGTACGFKQPALLEFAVPLTYVVVQYWRKGSDQKRRYLLYPLAALAMGFTASFTPAVIYFAVKQGIRQMIFLTWTYNFIYVGSIPLPEMFYNMLAGTGRVARWNMVFWGMGCMGFLFIIIFWKRLPMFLKSLYGDSMRFTAIWFLLSCSGVISGRRFVGHYFIQLLPVISILAACGWVVILNHLLNRNKFLFSVTLVAVVAGIVIPLNHYHGTIPMRWNALVSGVKTSEPAELSFFRNIARFISNNSSPQDTIFVWGFSPQIYYLSDRRPASRFLHCGYYTGATAFDASLDTGPSEARPRIIPGAQETLLRDLDMFQPAIIIDSTPTGHLGFTRFGLGAYPLISAFINDRYVFRINLAGVHIYERRQNHQLPD